MDQRLLVLSLLCYAATLRIQEALNVQVKHISFSSASMKIYIPKRKNDQYREGHYVTVAKTFTSACPVVAVQRLIQDAKLTSNGYLICRIAYTKNRYIAKSAGISYSRARDILRAGLAKYLGENFNFGTHSLRAGAATHAVNSGHVSQSALDKHVGWRSTKSKFRYVKDDEQASILVSSNLGL